VVRQLALIVVLFVVIVGCLIALFDVEVGVLWAVRAYVGGEGLWSKGQKDAVQHLARYAATYDEADYHAFRTAIAVPMGDHVARVELEKPAPDFRRVREAFIAARNHPDDADGMAQLFRRFRNVREMDQAIRIWSAGDHSIMKLVRYGGALHDAIAAPIPDTDAVRRLLWKIDRVNARVTPLEDAFSRTLGAGARRVRRLSIGMTLFAAAALLAFGIGASWMILRDARRSEDALRQSEARYRGLFEDAHEAVYVHDLDGRFLDLNKAAERLTGYTTADAVRLERLVAPEQQALAQRVLEQSVRDGGTGATELTIVAKDGRPVPVEVSTRAILEHERPVAVQGIARDVTERRRVEQERVELLERERAAREAAELANRTKDQFLAMLSHELRTPLTAILTWVHLLRDTRIDAESRMHALDVIERNTRLQTTVIGDLLDVSRIVAGKVHVELAPVDGAAVVAAAVDAMRDDVDRKSVTLALDLDPATPPALADRHRLQQIVSNLLSNAIKFTPEGGRVVVGLAPSGDDGVVLRVEDSGSGIPPEFLPHVFDPFRQADSSDTRPHGGLGLGLAIVRHLVELHGGRVEVSSDGVGRGAVFRVFLPAAAGADVPALPPLAAVGAAPSPTLLRGMDVLIVDDDGDTRMALGAALEERGARVRLVASAAEGLAAIDERLPDVLLCDLDMPGSSGLDLMRTLRARDPADGGDLPAAAITAHARDEDARIARAAGFQRHLAKPIDPLDLACTVAELAALPHLDRIA
jgi:PAS domain S-box-containing protein